MKKQGRFWMTMFILMMFFTSCGQKTNTAAVSQWQMAMNDEGD